MTRDQQTVEREPGTPMVWFAEAEDARLMVASGGGSRHPVWYVNLMAHGDRVAIERPGRDILLVTPHPVEGADRDQGWRRMATVQPRVAKYQSKSDREYPIIRLRPR